MQESETASMEAKNPRRHGTIRNLMRRRRALLVLLLILIAGCPARPEQLGLQAVDVKSDQTFTGLTYDTNAVSAYKLRTGQFRFSLGLTSPIHLLSYRDAPSLPDFCHRANILQKLEDMARAKGCDVTVSDLGGAPMRLITCKLLGGSDQDCPSSYVAQLWQERWSGSTEDYELNMYARVRTVCVREKDFVTYHAPDSVTAAAEGQSDEVTKLIAACKTSDGGSP